MADKGQISPRIQILRQYFCISYVLLLANSASLFWTLEQRDAFSSLFFVAAMAVQAFIFLLPVQLILSLLDWIGTWRIFSFLPGEVRKLFVAGWYGLAVLGFGAIQCLMYIDKTVFRMFSFHLNSFVWNLIMTPGGIESMGGDPSSRTSSALIVGTIFAIQLGVLLLLIFRPGLRRALASMAPLPVRRAWLIGDRRVMAAAGGNFWRLPHDGYPRTSDGGQVGAVLYPGDLHAAGRSIGDSCRPCGRRGPIADS